MIKIAFTFLLLGCLALVAPTFVSGQKANPKTVVARFGGECEGTKYRFSTRLKKLIQKYRQKHDYSCDTDSCNNAFAYDLNGDGRKEYFVRLLCGATGNCTYGIFSDRSAKLRGIFTAWFFFIHKRTGLWSKISTYTREGGDQGVIALLTHRRNGYIETAERTEHYSSTQEPFYVRMGLPNCP